MPNKSKNQKNQRQAPRQVVSNARPRNVMRNPPKPKQQRNQSSGLMSALGSLAGGYLGGPTGAALGGAAGKLISSISGFGAYTVNKNSLAMGNTVPTFKQSSEGVVIAHREFIGDVSGSTAFSLASLSINPGLPSTFPWLSTVAQNFEMYDMLGLVFEYRPSSGSAVSAASAALGVVVYATDYNVLSPNFQNKQTMESYEFSCSTVPFEGMLHPVECAPQSNPLQTLYIRTGSVQAGADQRMYDLGNFQYATQGMQSAYTVGELWVSYHVALKKPRIQPDTNSEYAHITALPVSSATAVAPLGTTGGSLLPQSNLLGVLPSAAAPTTSFVLSNPGNYLVALGAKGSTITSAASFTRGSNITLLANFFDGTLSAAISSFNATNAVNSVGFQVTAYGTGDANTITIGGLATMAAANLDILVTQLPTVVA